ncbi:peptide ABC transporter ATP-binding protein [halophilic archaeon]|nr:peptide ABC transporter ATP-binding protein [halophilic archaeon]
MNSRQKQHTNSQQDLGDKQLNQSTHRQSAKEPILALDKLKKYYPVRGGVFNRTIDHVKAVDGVSLDIAEGETLGLVGESGCGKSTLGKTVMRLIEPTDGTIWFDGNDITSTSRSELREIRQNLQFIFQDPASSLNPRMSVAELIQEPMKCLTDWSAKKRENRTFELIEEVGLNESHLTRAPHAFSGGQQQRIAIARALAVNPKLIIADEPTSALDVSVQAKILNLLDRLQDEYNLTYLFISHDLSVVHHICDRVAVMYLGELAELSNTTELFKDPKHPYTRALLSAVPEASEQPQSDRIILDGDVPSPQNPPSGCRYHTRCQEYIGPICEQADPDLEEVNGGSSCACHHYTDSAEVSPSEE